MNTIRTNFKPKREEADSLEMYFSERLLDPVREWQKEAQTNKAFYLGEKSFEYIPTVAGHEPVIEYPTE